ncbi:hypothetical protein C4D60_Mb08t22680 [Musa balbisiana]|uniref:Uncharacterized protein n=1 Tax=Musa balbisiana TaxID=52838 RepID=A0A4S8K5Q5_MUSBA|nr:hypothetical protein C4D60_Mb08t22680 [Musa balbisiana]
MRMFFTQLVKKFELHFFRNICPWPLVTTLHGLRQGGEEMLANFIAWFVNKIQSVAFMMRLKPSCLFWLLIERPLVIVLEILQMIKEKRLLKYPHPIKIPLAKRDKSKYYQFH